VQRVRYSIQLEQLRWLTFGFHTAPGIPIDHRDGYYLFQPRFYDRYYDRGNGETYSFTINSHGFRGEAIQQIKQDLRVVVTGGSATFGHANKDWETIKAITNPTTSEWMHQWFMDKSLLYMTANEKLQALRTGNINDLYRTTKDAEVARRTFENEDKWNAYGDALESIILECLRKDISLVFATEAVHLVPAERALSSWHEEELWNSTYIKGRSILTEMADRYNVPVVDTAALFDELDDETLFQYNDVIHLTVAGNQTVASALANKIIPMLPF
jgi:hypothetical protein